MGPAPPPFADWLPWLALPLALVCWSAKAAFAASLLLAKGEAYVAAVNGLAAATNQGMTCLNVEASYRQGQSGGKERNPGP